MSILRSGQDTDYFSSKYSIFLCISKIKKRKKNIQKQFYEKSIFPMQMLTVALTGPGEKYKITEIRVFSVSLCALLEIKPFYKSMS